MSESTSAPPLRRPRKSRDDVMTRVDTIGAGLSQLDGLIEELKTSPDARSPQTAAAAKTPHSALGLENSDIVTAALVLGIGSLLGMAFRPPPSWARCDNMCIHAYDGSCDDGGAGSLSDACAHGVDCADCGARDFDIPNWAVIVACLVTAALLLVGVKQTSRIVKDQLAKPMVEDAFSLKKLRVPLTDFPFGAAMVNKLANSTQVREKTLKVLQYILRGTAYSALLSKPLSKQLKELSKLTSIARRLFKFCRWVKHFEDIEEARGTKGAFMRGCLFLRIGANFGADWAEDVCSLERVGLLPKGTLSVGFMLFAEYCQLVLALVEILVTYVRARKELAVTTLAEASAADPASTDRVSDAKLLAQQRKLALVRLELIKFVSDVGKALYDCELPYAHEGVFIGCSLFSGVLSTHKNAFKILKT